MSCQLRKCTVRMMMLLCLLGVFRVKAQDSISFLPPIGLKPFNMDTISNLVPDYTELRAGLLYDVNRGMIVWEKNLDNTYPIASLTKMMVALLAIEDVKAGKVSFADTVVVETSYRKRLKRRKYTTVKVTERYTLSDLIKMAMVRSHNESTVWIAKHLAGTHDAFVDRMNKRAEELGMTKTHYNNPSGLPSPGVDNSASPRDLLILALECMKHPVMMEVTSMPYATVNNGKTDIKYRNHNGLTINYTGEVDGIKTGYTKAAGFCLVATAGRADHRLISIALGVRSPWVRNNIVAEMMNSYYDAIHLGRLGDGEPDWNSKEANCYLMDSLNLGLACVFPKVPAKHTTTEDAAYAYTYKTVTEKVKKSYTVRSGDNLTVIAKKYNCTVADLKRWNKLNTTRIQKGQRLYAYTTVKKKVPVKLEVMPCEDMVADSETDSCVDPSVNQAVMAQLSETENEDKAEIKTTAPKTSTAKPAVNAVKEKQVPKIVYHRVQPGDTLWNIAQKYHTTIQELKKVNGINGSKITVGAKLKVPVAS